MKKIVYILFLSFVWNSVVLAQGQTPPPNESQQIKISVDTAFMLMGDKNSLHLDLPEYFFRSIDFSLLDTLEEADLEVYDVDSIHESGRIKYDLGFTVWKPGIVELPRIPIVYGNGTINDTVYIEPIKIYVNIPYLDSTRVLDSITPMELIQPLKDIVVEELVWNDYKMYVYILGLLLIVGIAAFVYGRLKRVKVEEPEPEIIIPAHIIAFGKLQELKQQKLWADGNDKVYYSTLTYIIREYLENRYEIKALESTTKEVLGQLKNADLSKEHVSNLRTMLNLADMIKFAKAKAPEEEHVRLLNIGMELVDDTKEIIEETNTEK